MINQTVKTQAELDAALADAAIDCIHIQSEPRVWLDLGTHDKTVEASGSASVRAYDSASVYAYGSASVRASDSASVRASGSASVYASGSASVRASDSASVRASDSASVSASGSASVYASGSASVYASGSASVRASGGAKVDARHTSTIQAGPHVAVHLYSVRAAVTGGVLVDLTSLDLTDAATWCEHEGVDVLDGRAVLYKAVDAELAAGHKYRPTVYALGGVDLICSDWRDDNDCGGGYHLSPTPQQATYYYGVAKRWLRCTAALEDIRPIPDGMAKCKVRAVRVEAEVDVHGRDVAAPALSGGD